MSTGQPQQEPRLIWLALGGLIGLLLRLMGFAWVTLLWLAVAVLLLNDNMQTRRVWPLALFILLLMALYALASTTWGRPLRRFLPGTAEWGSRKRRTQRRRGNQLLRAFGFTTDTDPTNYATTATRGKNGEPGEWIINARLASLSDPAAVQHRIESQKAMVGAEHITTEKTGVGQYVVRFHSTTPDDTLATVQDWQEAASTVDAVPIGVRDDGNLMTWPVAGGHTLLAGASNSGKGSVIWSLLLGLGPLIKSGVVQVHGIDLKGGVEFNMGRELFAEIAEQPADAAAMIARMLEVADQRLAVLKASGLRKMKPSVEEPLHVVVIDEAASLKQRMPKKEYDAFLADFRTVLNIGRAPGVVFFAALQDPKVATFDARDLFTRQLMLRLKRSQAAMVSDLPTEDLPAVETIREDTPGVGYGVDTDTGAEVRFRAFWVSDDALRTGALRYEAPAQVGAPAECDED
ncbi:type IV secretory system conjugative DNA transfer family protein [Brachybacterium paraconglomeratum]|uniref:type IV secretory system conjugative DNA transfer family protein n=1 Tax=Brachybacterium paraconglomeratum TaxID=173362 RepID=UPI003FD377C0